MNKIGVLSQDDRIIFSQICQTISISNSPLIDVDDFLIDVIKWAERHNYAPLRSSNTTKKIIQDFCSSLVKMHLCQIKSEGNEIVAFTMMEPQFQQVAHVYKLMETSPETEFPVDQQLSLPLHPSKILEVLYEKINTQFIEENINKDKMIKIVFPDMNNHILVTPKLMVQLPSVCIRKLGKFFGVSGRIRILDAILKSMEIIVPEKNLKLDRIIKVLNLEDKESPIFFIHLTEGIINKIKKELSTPEYIPILQACMILKQFKVEQEENEKNERKEELARDDFKRILFIFQENPRAFYINELYHLREEEGRYGKFSGNYEKGDFAQLIDKFIDTYSVKKENAESPEEMAPEIVKLMDNESKEMYIHRSYLVSLLERERVHARDDIRQALLAKWTRVLGNHRELPEMKREDVLEKEVIKIIDQKYKLLKFATSEPVTLFTIFRIFENDKEINSKKIFYFGNKDKPILQPYYLILEIKRAELFQQAFLALPFIYRFFLTRILLSLINFFKQMMQENSRNAKTMSSSESGQENSSASGDSSGGDAKKSVQVKIIKLLPEIEKHYRSEGNVQEVLDDLAAKWNIKVGEVRTILKEKVDKDIMERSIAIYRMLLKSPNFTEEYLHRELKNMAVELAQNKYTEVHDKKSLARYVMILSISTLRQKTR